MSKIPHTAFKSRNSKPGNKEEKVCTSCVLISTNKYRPIINRPNAEII